MGRNTSRCEVYDSHCRTLRRHLEVLILPLSCGQPALSRASKVWQGSRSYVVISRPPEVTSRLRGAISFAVFYARSLLGERRWLFGPEIHTTATSLFAFSYLSNLPFFIQTHMTMIMVMMKNTRKFCPLYSCQENKHSFFFHQDSRVCYNITTNI